MLPTTAPAPRRRAARPVPAVLGAPGFRSVLTRERKRTERPGGSLVLALLTSGEGRSSRSPDWSVVIERLAAVAKPTDVIGWYESEAALGLLRSIPTTDSLRPGSAEQSGGGDLAVRLDRAAGSLCWIALLVHPEQIGSPKDDLRAIDPGLYPEVVFRRRADRVRDAGKRALDIVGSLLALALLVPALISIAVLVKMTSPGPALFAQTRVGYRGK